MNIVPPKATHHECYEHRRFKDDLYPSEEELKGLKQFMDIFYTVSMPRLFEFLGAYSEQ